jgi:hypothetical protein
LAIEKVEARDGSHREEGHGLKELLGRQLCNTEMHSWSIEKESVSHEGCSSTEILRFLDAGVHFLFQFLAD